MAALERLRTLPTAEAEMIPCGQKNAWARAVDDGRGRAVTRTASLEMQARDGAGSAGRPRDSGQSGSGGETMGGSGSATSSRDVRISGVPAAGTKRLGASPPCAAGRHRAIDVGAKCLFDWLACVAALLFFSPMLIDIAVAVAVKASA